MGLPVTALVGTVFRGADQEAQLNVAARLAAESLPNTSLPDTLKKVWQTVVSDRPGVGTVPVPHCREVGRLTCRGQLGMLSTA